MPWIFLSVFGLRSQTQQTWMGFVAHPGPTAIATQGDTLPFQDFTLCALTCLCGRAGHPSMGALPSSLHYPNSDQRGVRGCVPTSFHTPHWVLGGTHQRPGTSAVDKAGSVCHLRGPSDLARRAEAH